MPEFFPNPYWTALSTEQSSIALGSGAARRFAADVIPFAALREVTAEAMRDLHDLLAPGESIYVTGAVLPACAGIERRITYPGWQMHHTGFIAPPCPAKASGLPPVEALTAEHAAEMVELTDVAFPGFFRQRTHTLGTYIGIRGPNGQLIAMAGERLALPSLREISAVCTHPAHTGRGYAAQLLDHLLRMHRASGFGSLLHVLASNRRAIALYDRLGFSTVGEIVWHHVRRPTA